MKKVLSIIVFLAFVSVVNAGYDLKVKLTNDVPTTGEGPYTVSIIQDNMTSGKIYTGVFDSFKTFCVEDGEYYWPNKVHYATIDEKVKYSPDDYDLLSLTDNTKKIYAAYLNGHLDGVTGVQIQHAIWNSLGFGYSTDGVITSVISDDSNTTLWEYVKVLNLWAPENANATDESLIGTAAYDRQSQLVLVVPAPGAVLLAGLGTTLVGFVRRRSL